MKAGDKQSEPAVSGDSKVASQQPKLKELFSCVKTILNKQTPEMFQETNCSAIAELKLQLLRLAYSGYRTNLSSATEGVRKTRDGERRH